MWASIRVSHNIGTQDTLQTVGNRKFGRIGMILVLIYTPVSLSPGLETATNLAIVARNAFEGVKTNTSLWFRDANIQEGGRVDAWNQMRVTAEFLYDEIK